MLRTNFKYDFGILNFWAINLFMLSLNKIYKISFQCSKYCPVRHFATSNVGKSKPNYYKILDITEKATPTEIKAAFHKKGTQL